jgi:hypothetical protein
MMSCHRVILSTINALRNRAALRSFDSRLFIILHAIVYKHAKLVVEIVVVEL